jgi:hypothetical protein
MTEQTAHFVDKSSPPRNKNFESGDQWDFFLA